MIKRMEITDMKKKSKLKDLSKLHYLILALCLLIIIIVLVKIFLIKSNILVSRFYELDSKEDDVHGYLVQSFYKGYLNIDKIEFEDDICDFKYTFYINDKVVLDNKISDELCQLTNEKLKNTFEILRIGYEKKVNHVELYYEYNKKDKNVKKKVELENKRL